MYNWNISHTLLTFVLKYALDLRAIRNICICLVSRNTQWTSTRRPASLRCSWTPWRSQTRERSPLTWWTARPREPPAWCSSETVGGSGLNVFWIICYVCVPDRWPTAMEWRPSVFYLQWMATRGQHRPTLFSYKYYLLDEGGKGIVGILPFVYYSG